MAEDRYRVQSVERAFALLEALAEAGPEGMTLSNLARSLGVSKSTAYAILQTLLAGGFVADAGTGMARRYRLRVAPPPLRGGLLPHPPPPHLPMPRVSHPPPQTGPAPPPP